MVKLLIIADDFTGALDTGIQFVNKGIATQVFTKMPEAIGDIDETTEVLVIDSETRPMPAAKAYDAVKNITGWAKAIKIPVIFKKTDSALRGNIGSELQAVLDGSRHDKVYFLPGYPKIDRCTVNGTHYIQGQLLEKSVFGQDPFEPVKMSYIPDIIAQQTSLKCACVKRNEALNDIKSDERIVICDVEKHKDIEERLDELQEKDELCIIAGCAALAEALADKLRFDAVKPQSYRKSENFLVECGSLNMITQNQLDYAEEHGFSRIHMTIEQKLQKDYYSTQAGLEFLRKMQEECEKDRCLIIDSIDREEDKKGFMEANKLTMNDVRALIPTAHGHIADHLAANRQDTTILMTGGDTLMGYMKLIGCTQITPVCEIEQGVVVSNLKNHGFVQQIISKSGGFGTKDVLVKIADKILNQK